MDVILDFKVVVRTDGDKPKDSETLVNVENTIKLSYLLSESHLPIAESRFQKAWDSTLNEPVKTQFADSVRKLIEAKFQKEVEAEQMQQLPLADNVFLEDKETTNG